MPVSSRFDPCTVDRFGLGVSPLLLAWWVGWVAPVSPTHGVGLLLPIPRSPLVRTCVQCPGQLGSCQPVSPLGVLCRVCGVLGHLAPIHRCARSVLRVACAVSWATGLLFTGVLACCVALHVRCPRPLASCSPVCWLGALRGACAVSRASWLLFTGALARCTVLRALCPGLLGPCSPGVLAQCFVLCLRCPGPLGSCTPGCLLSVLCCMVVSRVRCPGPLSSCSPVCLPCVLCRVCGVLGHLPPVHRCACSVPCLACAVSWATCFLFTCVLPRCFVMCVRCPGPLAPVHRCARSVCCVLCAVSWASWLLFTGVLARCFLLSVQCPGPLGSCSPVCPLSRFCRVSGVLGHLAPAHQCVGSGFRVVCAVFWATWLLFTGVTARWVVSPMRCPGPRLHRCLGSVGCVASAVSLATGLLFTVVLARCFVLCVRCHVPLGSCSPVCPLCVLCGMCGVLGHLAPVHRCAPSVLCDVCTVSCTSHCPSRLEKAHATGPACRGAHARLLTRSSLRSPWGLGVRSRLVWLVDRWCKGSV